MIRKRLDVPSWMDWYSRPHGKYVRLGKEQKRRESLLLDVPVNSIHVYSEPKRELKGVVNTTRLSIEIGYYAGNLPKMFLAMAERAVKSTEGKINVPKTRLGVAGGFNSTNESLHCRDDEVLIIYTYQAFQGEQVLLATIEDLNIPYKETLIRPRYTPPDLSTCTKIEVQYEPSILDYFYPYKCQQRLLNNEETEYLKARKNIVIDNAHDISDFVNELGKVKRAGGAIVSEKSKAQVVAYQDNKRVTSFVIYDDTTIETEEHQRIQYMNKLQSLRKLTPKIRPFELRMQCAANLRNLWYRLRFCDRAEKNRVRSFSNFELDSKGRIDDLERMLNKGLTSEKIRENLANKAESSSESRTRGENESYIEIDLAYPAPQRWCDALELAFTGSNRGSWYELRMKAHVCPGTIGERSTYAMNSNCRYDSLPDMVLLFETEGGWNQHGGPELFTFDNHDPKGGCVLLNGGTVKSIRTEEELQQLCWK